MSISKVSVDLRARTFSVEVPDDKLDGILDRLALLFSTSAEEAEPAVEATISGSAAPHGASSSKVVEGEKPKRRSKGAGGKTKTWTIVDLGLGEDQRNTLRQFFSEKAPKGQGEEVAVLAVKLAEYTGRKSFTGDEIHSALKIVDRPTPKNLTAVFGNMKRDALGDYRGLDFILNHLTEDYVKFKLPKPAAKGK